MADRKVERETQLPADIVGKLSGDPGIVVRFGKGTSEGHTLVPFLITFIAMDSPFIKFLESQGMPFPYLDEDPEDKEI